MAHDINRMIYVGEVPWHGLGVRLPSRASYQEIVQAAGFYEAVEQDVFVPPNPRPVPDRKALVRGDTGAYLSVVGKSYEMVQFSEVARTLVEAAGDVKAVFTTAGTLGPVGIRGWLLGELPNPIQVKGDPSPDQEVRARHHGARRRHRRGHQERGDEGGLREHPGRGARRARWSGLEDRPYHQRQGAPGGSWQGLPADGPLLRATG